MTNCPNCTGYLQVSTRIVEGHKAYACRRCALWWVDGHAEPIKPGPELAQAIRLVLGIVEQDKESRAQMMDAEPDDPRWDSYVVVGGGS